MIIATRQHDIPRRGGIAYGVFKCSDPRPVTEVLNRFKEALENIKQAHEETGIPPQTSFIVAHSSVQPDATHPLAAYLLKVDGADALINIPEVEALTANGASFLIRSLLPNATNATTARDLGDVMNMLYGGTELFDAENEGREKTVMGVFYKNDSGSFVSWLYNS